MWSTVNRTPYAVGHAWGREPNGAHEWLVAVRATFDIGKGGRLTIADEQPEPLLAPEYNGEPGSSSLKYEADLVSPKRATDVLVNGTAYAPGGRPSTDFECSFRVGRSVAKTLRVLGARAWVEGAVSLRASETEPLVEVPIVYERAYGGYDAADPDPAMQRMDLRNPVGRGVAARTERLLGQPLHNFEYPGQRAGESGPAGFGPIASHWLPRIGLQGTYGAEWEMNRKPLLPADWDPRCLQCAPHDQQAPGHLLGGERIELINLTRDGRLGFELPRADFSFTTYFSTRHGLRTVEHGAHLSSVIIEPDHPRVAMVWATALPVLEHEDYLEKTVVREKPQI